MTKPAFKKPVWIIILPFFLLLIIILLIFGGGLVHNFQITSFKNSLNTIDGSGIATVASHEEFGNLYGAGSHCDYMQSVAYSSSLSLSDFSEQIKQTVDKTQSPFGDAVYSQIYTKQGDQIYVVMQNTSYALGKSTYSSDYIIPAANIDFILEDWEYNTIAGLFDNPDATYVVTFGAQSIDYWDVNTDYRCY